ncbi:hypothetical protein VTI74DRAFT_8948 [Chaetomium olivicolor]
MGRRSQELVRKAVRRETHEKSLLVGQPWTKMQEPGSSLADLFWKSIKNRQSGSMGPNFMMAAPVLPEGAG